MVKSARFLEIFVAGPCDTAADKQVVRDVVDEWNRANARHERVFLDVHTMDDVPSNVARGKSGQSVIDAHIIDEMEIDILVVIFRKRLGTQYEFSPSASVHELDLCEKNGAMCSVYFAEGETFAEGEIQEGSRLGAFRDELMQANDASKLGGLVGFFGSHESLADKLRKDIRAKVRTLVQEADTPDEVIKSQTEFDPLEDKRRLDAQSRFMEPLDKRVVQSVLRKIKRAAAGPIAVLDAGCGDGEVTLSRFGGLEGVDVHGIDRNEDAIALAKRAYEEHQAKGSIRCAGAKFTALEISQFLKTAPEFDVVYSALTLHHVGDSQSTLADLWGMVRSGGAMVIRSSDDGMKLHYPDVSTEFATFVDLSNKAAGASDRQHGRKLYGQACALRPKPKRMSMEFQVVSTVGMTKGERAEFFLVNHSYRADAAVRHASRPGSSRKARADALRLLELRNEMRKRFERDDDIFSMATHCVLIAWKP